MRVSDKVIKTNITTLQHTIKTHPIKDKCATFSQKKMSSDRDNSLLVLGKALAMAGVPTLVKLPTIPLDSVRSILQTQAADPRVVKGERAPFKNSIQVLTQVSKEQGVTAFWRGHTVDLAKNLLKFLIVNPLVSTLVLELFPRYSPQTTYVKIFLRSIVSGWLGGSCVLLATQPLEYARFRLAVDVVGERQFTGLMDVFKKTVAGPNGFLSLYTGLGVSVTKILAYRIMYFVGYDILRSLNPLKDDNGVLGILSKFFIAEATVFLAQLTWYPFDTICKRMQLQADKPKEEWLYEDSIDCAKKIVKKEGIMGFYKGYETLVFGSVASAVLLILSDQLFGQ